MAAHVRILEQHVAARPLSSKHDEMGEMPKLPAN